MAIDLLIFTSQVDLSDPDTEPVVTVWEKFKYFNKLVNFATGYGGYLVVWDLETIKTISTYLFCPYNKAVYKSSNYYFGEYDYCE